MSAPVKSHEAFGLNSQEQQLLWWDDFLGDALDDRWRTTGSAGGSGAVVDAQTGGIVRLTTDTDNIDNWQLDWGDIRTLLVSKKVTFEARVKVTVTTADINIGMNFAGNESIYFLSDDSGDWFLWNRTAGGITQPTSGISIDGDWHIYRIECFPTGEVHFFIDDVEPANSPNTTNITVNYMQPFFNIICQDVGVAQVMDIDYVVIRQER